MDPRLASDGFLFVGAVLFLVAGLYALWAEHRFRREQAQAFQRVHAAVREMESLQQQAAEAVRLLQSLPPPPPPVPHVLPGYPAERFPKVYALLCETWALRGQPFDERVARRLLAHCRLDPAAFDFETEVEPLSGLRTLRGRQKILEAAELELTMREVT